MNIGEIYIDVPFNLKIIYHRLIYDTIIFNKFYLFTIIRSDLNISKYCENVIQTTSDKLY